MKNAVKETNAPEIPALVKTIGKTTYIVNVHFSDTARETVADKLKRLISTDAELREG
ncbi:MAG: transposon-encoded TnpW family protein [Ruminiclostridium sp.]|uniref:transposon-encoded TnpW family protein n=1 Tax=Ruminococcus sp. TaxID=41978 RepID=UPI0025D3AA94|nr:transposon-encoded TnpW family protein [Ruminococcus sp.]MBR1432624.1 transposon-encoded TnpW family protein [Ruminococcus sp.]MBR1830981.1 transposon-encoded TnpW family protein [Ruminiclostridium sp.]